MRKAVFPMNLQYFAEGETEQEVADPAGEVLDSGLEETSDEGETGQEVTGGKCQICSSQTRCGGSAEKD